MKQLPVKPLSIPERLAKNRFVLDDDESHIEVNQKIVKATGCGTAIVACCAGTARKMESDFADRSVTQGPASAININRADAAELERLPGVGPALAKKIIEHRTRYGAFRRIENLMLVEGVSDRRFREIRHLIVAE